MATKLTKAQKEYNAQRHLQHAAFQFSGDVLDLSLRKKLRDAALAYARAKGYGRNKK